MPRVLKLVVMCGALAALAGASQAEPYSAAMRAAARTLMEEAESSRSVTLPAAGVLEVAFSPNGGATEAVVRFINEAQRSIYVAAYGLTSNPIGQALVAANKRGVEVRVVVDREYNGRRDSPNSVVNFLAANGIPVRINSAVKIQHNKLVLVDHESVLNGSLNFTRAAERNNAENIIIHRHHPALARVFEQNFAKLWAQSQDFRPTY